jgi:hypothetical protein
MKIHQFSPIIVVLQPGHLAAAAETAEERGWGPGRGRGGGN